MMIRLLGRRCLSMAIILLFGPLLASSRKAEQHLRNLAFDAKKDNNPNLPPLAIKKAIQKNDDPHEKKEKKDLYGNVITPRIVGGRDSEAGEFPFFVRVDHNYYPTCGGTLVAPDVVLTAGHCLIENKTITAIVNGYHDNPNVLPDQHPRAIVEFVRHSAYDTEKYYNDMMLMRLEEPVYDVPYVELNMDPDYPEIGETVTACGLGALEEAGTSFPDMLQVVDLGIVNHDVCDAIFSAVGLGPILDDIMVCAGSITNAPQDSCQGDSGGPLLNSDNVQVGVISFGMGCARIGVPGVYARTAPRGDTQDWLHDTLCDLTQTNDLDAWCGKRSSLAMAQQEEPDAGVTPMPSIAVISQPMTTNAPVTGGTTSMPSAAVEPMTEAQVTGVPTSMPSVAVEPPTLAPTFAETEASGETLLPTSSETLSETIDGTLDADNQGVVDVDLCIDESGAIIQILNGEYDCRWLRCAHEAIRQSACVEGNEAWGLCRATCGRCPDS